jgi:hypothetical protein
MTAVTSRSLYERLSSHGDHEIAARMALDKLAQIMTKPYANTPDSL